MLQQDQKQKTLKKAISLTGKGLFSGKYVHLTLYPSENTGIVFHRINQGEKICFPSKLEYVQRAHMFTLLGTEKGGVQMVEHLLSALSAYGIDNVIVEVKGPEIPAVDGSAFPFVEMIEKAGIELLPKPRKEISLTQPVHWSDGAVHMVALPSSHLQISYTLHYPENKFFRSQFATFSISPEIYKKEIAPARTFSFYEEIQPFLEKGFIKGGGLENAVVIKEEKILNPEGLRFPEEQARHKMLDLIGDLTLLGADVKAHIIAIGSGHSSNISFAKKLEKYVAMEKIL